MTVTLEAGLVGRSEIGLTTFYLEVVGFTLAERFEFDIGIACKLERGATRLKLFFPHTPLDGSAPARTWFQPGGWRYAALNLDELEDVDAVVRVARAAGGSVLLKPTGHRPGARTAMITDPEGNAWELLAVTDNRDRNP
jgi:predicted enzyme related to lactoylglutathione lyase